MGLRGWGRTVSEAFEEAAAAMFEVMADGEGVDTMVEVAIACTGTDLEELLVEFLNQLLCRADIKELVFLGVAVGRIEKGQTGWELEAVAHGIPSRELTGRLLVEVKAATYCGVAVSSDEHGRWIAQCVIDL
jgi:SHS2 domain-containing protein